MADGELALLQHRTKLYIVNIPIVSAELFRQLALQRFGRLRPIRVDPPAPLADMLLLALEEEERRGRWGAEDGSKEARARALGAGRGGEGIQRDGAAVGVLWLPRSFLPKKGGISSPVHLTPPVCLSLYPPVRSPWQR